MRACRGRDHAMVSWGCKLLADLSTTCLQSWTVFGITVCVAELLLPYLVFLEDKEKIFLWLFKDPKTTLRRSVLHRGSHRHCTPVCFHGIVLLGQPPSHWPCNHPCTRFCHRAIKRAGCFVLANCSPVLQFFFSSFPQTVGAYSLFFNALGSATNTDWKGTLSSAFILVWTECVIFLKSRTEHMFLFSNEQQKNIQLTP